MNLSSKTMAYAALVFASAAYAQNTPHFEPFDVTQKHIATFRVSGFLADDAISLYDFFHDWKGELHARKGTNVVLELFRTDMGYTFQNGWYLGYFYQYNLFIPASNGMVRGYYALKNDLTPSREKTYDLFIGIEGIRRHGIQCSIPFYFTKGSHRFAVAFAPYFSYDTDIQLGELVGAGTIYPDDRYNAQGNADYYFTRNYLYDGWDVSPSHGYGYGLHMALLYRYAPLLLTVTLQANDIAAKSKWNDIAHSYVTIQTQNGKFDENGYVYYDPAISGKEEVLAKTFSLPTSYYANIRYATTTYKIEVGADRVYDTTLPYGGIAVSLVEGKYEAYTRYETRFDTLTLGIKSRHWFVEVRSNGFSDTSAIGFDASYRLRF